MSRRLKAIEVSGYFFHRMMTEGWEARERCVQGLPEGAQFVGLFYKAFQGYENTPSLVFVFEHPSFDEVPEGESIPFLDMVWETVVYTNKPPWTSIKDSTADNGR